jgi:hypothetical protein
MPEVKESAGKAFSGPIAQISFDTVVTECNLLYSAPVVDFLRLRGRGLSPKGW